MKDIKGFEGVYAITPEGEVYSYYTKKFRKQQVNQNGYVSVLLSKDGKQKRFYTHRLVAEAYLPDYDNKLDVNHKDECKTNNHVSNLEMVSRQQNINYGSRNVRAAKSRGKPIICIETNKEYYSAREAARELNLWQSSISRCCNGQMKSVNGLHFKYKEV